MADQVEAAAGQVEAQQPDPRNAAEQMLQDLVFDAISDALGRDFHAGSRLIASWNVIDALTAAGFAVVRVCDGTLQHGTELAETTVTWFEAVNPDTGGIALSLSTRDETAHRARARVEEWIAAHGRGGDGYELRVREQSWHTSPAVWRETQR